MQPILNISAETLHLHLDANGGSAVKLHATVNADAMCAASLIAGAPNFDERFSFTITHGAELVIDHKTGLMWPVYESENAMDADALDKYVAAFRLGDFNDWFIPSVEQRESIRDLSRFAPALFPPLKSRQNGWEWTSTSYAPAGKTDAGVPAALWQFSGSYGYLSRDTRYNGAFARPCRFVARAGQ